MKKKLFLAAGAMLAAAAVSAFVYVNNERNSMSDLFKANIEALTHTESGCGYAAYQYDDDWYEDSVTFRRCGDCQWVRGTNPCYTSC